MRAICNVVPVDSARLSPRIGPTLFLALGFTVLGFLSVRVSKAGRLSTCPGLSGGASPDDRFSQFGLGASQPRAEDLNPSTLRELSALQEERERGG